ncbi:MULTISPECIES: 2-isopropylmalate synthase [unclassified Sedimentibacter]|uniref:2-isopropylmalate synthase n=1 Tax=unclassified Sedimentibacter TaxID=2649220 RepID=UPI0027E0C376|nr:2-isopropylmalate synthase [Sedimentibacter sp. MB35-C1]WMJ78221.1 2-isopropylmalate synthase [Sedimentibacter sp. MB35-C1]
MKYNPVEVIKPKLYKDIFPYDEIPKIKFNNIQLPISIPENIWITDTTFRDGQQSMTNMHTEQMVRLYDFLHELDNESGIIKQTEFFLYTQKDRKAVETCMEKGYKFPEITSWIRANKEDFKLVKSMGIKETGILMSCSDYHIFNKLNKTRQEAMKMYLDIAYAALENGIVPRCHFEDITRADFYGFVVPLAKNLMEMMKESKINVKIRACDTLGLGISHAGTELPRSVPAIIHGLRYYAGVPSESIEWHGHNDYYATVTNASTSWLYGGSSVNSTMFGVGERVGNTPLEAMIIEYAQIKGNTKSMNLEIINEIEDYFEKELNYNIPVKTPYVGREFNVTKAGIHADGLLKDEEIYNSFDTRKILGKPPLVAINSYSGISSIAYWINSYFGLEGSEKMQKNDPRLIPLKNKIDEEYERGRTTNISAKEMIVMSNVYVFDNKYNEKII